MIAPQANSSTVETPLLNSIDIEHICAILTNTVEKLALIGAIKLDVQAEAEELTASVGEGIYGLIQKQRTLETEFKNVVNTEHHSPDTNHESKATSHFFNTFTNGYQQMKDISESLKKSTRQLCRNLRDNPNIVDNMGKVGRVRHSTIQLLNKGITELKTQGEIKCLLEAVLTHDKAEIQTKTTIAHEKEISNIVKDLKSSIRGEKIQHEIKVQEMKKRNAKLKEDLKQLKLETAAQSSLMEKQLFAENENSNRKEKDDLSGLDYNISTFKYKTKMEKSRHAAIMDHLNKNISTTSTNNNQWTEYSKSLISSKQEEIKVRFQLQLKLSQKEEMVVQICALDERIKVELSQKHARELEEQTCLEEEHRLQTMHETAQRAALRIQSLWRGWKVRKASKNSKPNSNRKGRK